MARTATSGPARREPGQTSPPRRTGPAAHPAPRSLQIASWRPPPSALPHGGPAPGYHLAAGPTAAAITDAARVTIPWGYCQYPLPDGGEPTGSTAPLVRLSPGRQSALVQAPGQGWRAGACPRTE